MRASTAAIALIALAAGVAIGYGWQARQGVAEQDAAADPAGRDVRFYRHPMDPSITSPTPAKDSMGMDYIPVYADDEAAEDGSRAVRVAPELRQGLGVRTAPVRRSALEQAVRATGVLTWDESRIVHLHTRASGWVRDLHAHAVGDAVRAGQALVTLDSNELDAAQREHLVALGGGDAALAQASRERLRALGMTPAQVRTLERSGRSSRAVAIRAPLDGVVTALGVRHGMYVAPDVELVALAALDPLWVDAEVLEREAAAVRVGDAARIEVPQQPGRTREARVSYVYPELDPRTRAQRVRLVVDNADHALRAGMWVSVRIGAAASEPVLAVPAEALIRTGSGARVVIERADGGFEARPVRIGRSAGALVEVREGVVEGERVVTSAQFLLDAEAAVQPALAALGRADAEPAPEHAAGHGEPAAPGGEGHAPRGPEPQARTEAVVRAIDAAAGTITLEHPAIEALGMPAMTMPFALAPAVEVSGIEAGQRVWVGIAESAQGPVITELEAVDAP